MLDLKDLKIQNTVDLIKAMNETLAFYGFVSIDNLVFPDDNPKDLTGKLKANTDPGELSEIEKYMLSMVKKFAKDTKLLHKSSKAQFYTLPDLKKSSKSQYVEYGIHFFGEKDPFAEAFLVSMAAILLNKLFNKNILLEVNSIGDKDSAEKYLEDVRRFLKRNKKSLPADALEALLDAKINKSLGLLVNMGHELADAAPSLMDYLSDYAQKHLYLFLDYMDKIGINYYLNPHMLGNPKIRKHLMFNIYTQDDDEKRLIASGGRYDNAIDSLYQLDKSVVSLRFKIKRQGRKYKIQDTQSKPGDSCKFYFLQIGVLAKSQATKLLEEMIKSKIDVYHAVSELSLLEQYALAKKKGAKYVIVLGHKEAIDSTVIVRNVATQNQKIIAQSKLISYLKKLK